MAPGLFSYSPVYKIFHGVRIILHKSRNLIKSPSFDVILVRVTYLWYLNFRCIV